MPSLCDSIVQNVFARDLFIILPIVVDHFSQPHTTILCSLLTVIICIKHFQRDFAIAIPWQVDKRLWRHIVSYVIVNKIHLKTKFPISDKGSPPSLSLVGHC